MEILICKDYDEISAKAATAVIGAIRAKPNLVLGLATGSTPEGLYARLAKACSSGKVDFSAVTTFNLDEYVGLAPDHEQSYRYYMNKHLFDWVNVDKANTHLPDGLAPELTTHCAQYEAMIAGAGGIDLQVLGIGRDGHLGFNEPGSSLASGTQVVTLFRDTIVDNSRLFDSEDEVPRFAITMGVQTILGSRMALLLANGESKADAVRGCVEGPVTAMCTASALQLHPNVVLILDEAAASKLQHLDHYKWCQQAKGQLAGRL